MISIQRAKPTPTEESARLQTRVNELQQELDGLMAEKNEREQELKFEIDRLRRVKRDMELQLEGVNTNQMERDTMELQRLRADLQGLLFHPCSVF